MHLAMLSPIAWRTPPRKYGPWESIASVLTEKLVEKGIDVTLFATGDSKTKARLHSIVSKGYEEDKKLNSQVWQCLHISELFEQSEKFDLIHNHFDFLPLTYSSLTSTPMITTIHGFSSIEILPVYKKYNGKVYYVSISNSDRSPELDYITTIHHGIDLKQFTLNSKPGEYLLFFGRIHNDKGTKEAIEIAKRAKRQLIISGIIQDSTYFEKEVKPHIDNNSIMYIGSSGPKKRNELLKNAYALLHPINFNEPFGLSVIESMACGTPVIAFNRGSMQELIENKKTGFLVSSVEEAVDAVTNIGEINRIECRKHVENRFTSDRMANDYLTLYKKILENIK